MASRKAKPKKRPSAPDIASSGRLSSGELSDESSRTALPDASPSGSLTVEVEALSVNQLIVAARGSTKNLPPAPPTTARVLEDLAATVEVPALSSLGPRILIMDSAEALIADRGFNHTTIREVAEWSGVSVDVFHAHFADMRALLVALCERFSDVVMVTIDDATRPSKWDGASMAQPVEHAVKGVVELMLSRAALLRAILSNTDRSLVDEIRRIGTHLTIRLTRLLNDLPGAPDAIDVGFAVLSAISIAHHAATVGPEWSGVELDRAKLAERAAQAATAYLASTRRAK
jgi:AcrR family transcriptional regulator